MRAEGGGQKAEGSWQRLHTAHCKLQTWVIDPRSTVLRGPFTNHHSRRSRFCIIQTDEKRIPAVDHGPGRFRRHGGSHAGGELREPVRDMPSARDRRRTEGRRHGGLGAARAGGPLLLSPNPCERLMCIGGVEQWNPLNWPRHGRDPRRKDSWTSP